MSPAVPAHGDLVATLREGAVEIRVRHSCIRRDLYELSTTAPLPEPVIEALRKRGTVKADSAALVIVEVAGVHQLTIAPGQGRVVIMPKLATTRAQQRQAALLVARALKPA